MYLPHRYFVFIVLIIGIGVVVFLLHSRVVPQKQERMSNPLLLYSAYQYPSEKKSDRPSLEIFSYNLLTQEKHALAAYPSPTMPDPYVQSTFNLFRRSSDSGSYYFFKTQQQGSTRTMVKIGRGGVEREVRFALQPGTDIALSQDEMTMAWCNEGVLHVRKFDTNTETTMPNETACSLGSVDFTFSRDGKKLYYRRGFYELFEEYTNEQVKQWARENHNGLHVIDLASRDDTIVTPEEQGILFRDDPFIDERRGWVLVIPPARDRMIVKALPNQEFDYLLASDIQKLTTIQEIKMPNRIFQEVVLTADGRGIFFMVSPENDPNFSGQELGYVDMQSGVMTFPIAVAVPEKKLIRPFAALDASHMYVLISPSNYFEDRVIDLNEIRPNGTLQLIDSITDGQFDLVGVSL